MRLEKLLYNLDLPINSGAVNIQKRGYIESKEEIYVIISIAAFIFVIFFAINSVYTTEAVWGNTNSPSGMASYIKENNTNMESILIKNGTQYQLRKLQLR